MFLVEIRIPHEDNLATEMRAMRTWLDHQKFEPTTFRYTFAPPGVVFRVDFIAKDEAIAFAAAFGGRVMQPRGLAPTERQEDERSRPNAESGPSSP